MRFALERIAVSALLSIVCGLAHASEVLKVFNEELILLNHGTDIGYAKGEEICFYTKKKNEKVACGSIEIVESNRAYVKVPADLSKRIVPGMLATTAHELAQAEARLAEKIATAAARDQAVAQEKAAALAATAAREQAAAQEKAATLYAAAEAAAYVVEQTSLKNSCRLSD